MQLTAGVPVIKLIFCSGPDANTFATQSTTSTGQVISAVKQAYVDLKAPIGNGLDFKIGVWDTIIGYEVFESGNNPNFTRSYGYTIEPTTHTGVLASYQFCDMYRRFRRHRQYLRAQINERANSVPRLNHTRPIWAPSPSPRPRIGAGLLVPLSTAVSSMASTPLRQPLAAVRC